ncbi:MAG: penicillin-binding protein [Alphaproteobacteria bacterium RIFCSPHIGHO2_12_FULL_45_9]|nr:MAG: penicillin-binding protein [Alphaproteobacteria bacterium RIFCSPHIGHO2_12_FULL_45_9]
MKILWRMFLFLFSIGCISAIAGVILFAAVIYKFGQSLPDFKNLENYQPAVVTRVHAGDGRFLAEFAQERRIFVPIQEIPETIIQAFTSAEDKNFYKHKGVDPFAIARAIVTNIKNRGEDRRPVGASTITQQVAKNFLLTNEVSYERKIREAILAYKLEETFSKNRILELYLNQIFLGQRSYGVAAAGLNYFNKPLNELSIAEVAFLAALPKAPNNYNPETRHAEAIGRRNWVIDRMLEDGRISQQQADEAKATPLVTVPRSNSDFVDAPYYAEEVRRELQKDYGDDALYRGGLSVRTSLDPKLQNIAVDALQHGLMAYDRKHGWRGAISQATTTKDFASTLKNAVAPSGMISKWRLAMVLSSKGDIGFADESKGRIVADDVTWANRNPLKAGDIIMTEPFKDEKTKEKGLFNLRQIPLVQGALVALDPNTGRVLAMQGGWKTEGNEFNRATQAKRQPGSAFKPFVYLAALDKGYTPSSIIMDTPITFTDTAGNVWKPENYHGDFLGPTPLRVGVEKSRNLMTIHLAQAIGIDTVVAYAKNFGIDDNMPANLSNVLGADETTLIQLTAAYGMIVNGGKKISPVFIDRVQDRTGKTIKNADNRTCTACGPLMKWENQATPTIPDSREQIADPRTAYQMVSILEGVVQRGTAKALLDLNIPIAGKTGTTNDSKDAWFVGFTPDLVAGVYIGFDDPKSLGAKETGGSLALPVFKEFMKTALDGVPPTPFRVPDDVRMVQVNARTGKPTTASDPDAIWEPFLDGTEPDSNYASPTGNDSGDGVYQPPAVSDKLPAEDMLTPNPDDSSPSSLEGTGGVY